MSKLNDIRLFLLDMDGTIYLDNDLFDGTLEFLAKSQGKFYNIPLRELNIKDNCLIACILRGTEVIVPDGNTTIQLGDNVIVVTTHKKFDDLTDIFD